MKKVEGQRTFAAKKRKQFEIREAIKLKLDSLH